MKRRATNRRQVLDLDSKSSSPKRSWQTKYQQIVINHNDTSNAVALAKNGSVNQQKVVPNLVGYNSDSDADESTLENDVDPKVDVIVKDISDTVTVQSSTALKPEKSIANEKHPKSVKDVKSKTKNSVGIDRKSTPLSKELKHAQPATIAWQECYDEGSGCYYYWNTETNEVTWEVPQALQAYRIALEQWNAQQLLFSQRAGGLVPAGKNESQPSTKTQQNQMKLNSNKSQEKAKHKKPKTKSESEDEKIELITSYGPNSDDDDSDGASEPLPIKKKKITESLKLSKEEIAIGPQLPPGYVVQSPVKEDEPLKVPIDAQSKISCENVSPPKETETNPATENTVLGDIPTKPIVDKLDKQTDQREGHQQNKEIIANLQRLKTLKDKGSDSEDSNSSSSSSSGSSSSSSDSDSSGDDDEKHQSAENNDNEDGDDEEEDDTENVILERLKDQAKILQELGGEIPEAIKELIEPSSEGEEGTSKLTLNEDSKPESKVVAQEIDKEEIPDNTEVPQKIEDLSNTVPLLGNTEEPISNLPELFIASEEEEAVNKTENTTERCDIHIATNNTSKLELLIQEKTPTSFSLIAGYGNEDDSEGDDDKSDDIVKSNESTGPLFPIVENSKNLNVKVIKLSAKAKELIHSSTTTGKARATNFVPTSEGLRPSKEATKENDFVNNVNTEHQTDVVEPIKKLSRKKRLEVPVIVKKDIEPESNEVASKLSVELSDTPTSEKPETKTDAAVAQSHIPYSTTWSYNSELMGGEHRGFGFGHGFDTDKKSKTAKTGMIQFIKADTLMPTNEPVEQQEIKTVEENTKHFKHEKETSDVQKDKAMELGQLIIEKVKFLIEGKEPVPPVQVMAIQLETLMAALSAGGLSIKYMLEWLTSLDSQLAGLEQAAAPVGWQCQWDRSYKRYYYRNEESGTIQWEYPSVSSTAQGGEEAMELCDSPPPQPQPPQPAPSDTLPPPLPVTPPPPRISSRSPSPCQTSTAERVAAPLPPLPPPPPVISEQPPLPPLPPSESPPPLPPSPPPPPPPPIISITLSSGEPMPPGVDLPEEMYESGQPPLPAVPPPPPKSPPPPPPPPNTIEDVEPVYSEDIEMSSVHMQYGPYPLQAAGDFCPNSTVFPAYSSAAETYIIARPQANSPAANVSLATELDSFYSEVAALEPPPPPLPSPPSPPPPSPPPVQQLQTVEPTKKRKKTKLAPGLALKKKGVPSLVAKWQQVQQDVRREEENEDRPN